VYLNAYKKWITLSPREMNKWASAAGIRIQSMKQFVILVGDLLKKTNKAIRVANSYGSYDEEDEDEENADLEIDSEHLDPSVLDLDYVTSQKELNYFRLILTWISTDNIIMQERIEDKDKNPPFLSVIQRPIARKAIQNLYAPVNLISTTKDSQCHVGSYSIPFEIKSEGKQSISKQLLGLLYLWCPPYVPYRAMCYSTVIILCLSCFLEFSVICQTAASLPSIHL
jgi:hypothetical protein